MDKTKEIQKKTGLSHKMIGMLKTVSFEQYTIKADDLKANTRKALEGRGLVETVKDAFEDTWYVMPTPSGFMVATLIKMLETD